MIRIGGEGRVATPSRFELPISSLTGRRVRPLHHGATFRTWALGEICPATVSYRLTQWWGLNQYRGLGGSQTRPYIAVGSLKRRLSPE